MQFEPPPQAVILQVIHSYWLSRTVYLAARLKLADSRELTQATYLLGFASGIARRQSVLSLQFADCAGAPEPFRQHVDDSGIDVIDAIAHVSKF